jgi:general secretion pathway protein I
VTSPATLRARRQRGLTLVEVLVALVIAALALPAIVRTLATSLDRQQRAERQGAALVVAQSRLEGLDVPLASAVFRESGRDGSLTWQLTASPAGSNGLPLARVEVTVSRAGAGSPLVRLVTLRPVRAETGP